MFSASKHEMNVQQERPVPRPDESEGPQTKRTSSPEDSVSLPQQETNHISTDTENNYDSTVSSEKGPQVPRNPSDSNTEKESNPPQNADVEAESPDAPDISPNAETSNSLAKPEITSDNNLQETTVEKTPDTTPIMDQQSPEDIQGMCSCRSLHSQSMIKEVSFLKICSNQGNFRETSHRPAHISKQPFSPSVLSFSLLMWFVDQTMMRCL